MSGAVSSNYGTLGLLLASTRNLNGQLATLQEQTSTGNVSQDYAGLGGGAQQVMSFNAAVSQAGAYSTAITAAQGRASAMQTALTQLQSTASSVANAALSLTGTTAASSTTAIAQQAKQALSQVAALLNTQYGGEYVFSGADTANPPVPNAGAIGSSGMVTQIAAQVAQLGTAPVGTIITNTVAAASSTAPGTTVFSSYLTGAGANAAAGTVEIAPGQSVSLDMPANQNVGAVSDPAINGTGSAVSDIMRSLAVLSNLPAGQTNTADFQTLVQNAVTTLNSAAQTVTEESGALGLTQTTLTTAATQNSTLQTAMKTQLSSLTDVDMASAISKLQATSSQLEASYQVIAMTKQLSLANYITP